MSHPIVREIRGVAVSAQKITITEGEGAVRLAVGITDVYLTPEEAYAVSEAINLIIGRVLARQKAPPDPVAAARGAKGGRRRAEVLPSERRVEIARNAAKTRWATMEKT